MIEHLQKLHDPEFVFNKIGIVIPKERIDYAIKMIQEWPDNVPVPDMNEENGEIHFFVFDEDGFSVAGMEIYGDDNKCAYSIGCIGREAVGEFDVSSFAGRKNIINY